MAPYPADGLDWLDGMGAENVAEFGAAQRGEAALTEFLGQQAAMLGTVTGESVASSLGGLVIEADKAVLTGEFAAHVAASLRAALSAGIAGWRDDEAAKAWTPTKPDAAASLRHRSVRVIRDYGMSDRREAPQFYPDVKRGADAAPAARRRAVG